MVGPAMTDEEQLSLPLSAYQLGEAGRELAYEHASDEWKELAFAAVEAVARKHPFFIADHVWEELGGDPPNRSLGSAMGGIFVRAQKAGVIERVQSTYRRSERPLTHGKPLPVWHSCIFQGAQ